MKKVLFFACVAMMAAMVVSCGEKKKVLEGETVETDVTNKENPAAATADAEKAKVKAPEFKAETFECDYFTAEFPAGHKAEVADNYGWRGNVFPLNDDGTQANSGTYVQLIHPAKETVAEFIAKQSKVVGKIKPIEKYGTGTYEIGGKKFQTWFKAGMIYFLCEDTKNGGYYNFAVPNFAFEKQELVMGVLNSIKFK